MEFHTSALLEAYHKNKFHLIIIHDELAKINISLTGTHDFIQDKNIFILTTRGFKNLNLLEQLPNNLNNLNRPSGTVGFMHLVIFF